jgi:putative ABC transport system permease protein
MRTLTQVLAITAMNLRNLPQRVGTSLVVVVGIAGVVGVLVSVLAMAEGFRHTLASTGRADRVIMLRAGSDAELSSGVDRDQATLLASLPGVARDEAGRPQASAELVVMVDLPRKGESNPNNVPFRGVQRAGGKDLDFEPTAAYVLSLVYLSVLGSILAFASYLTLLKRTGAARSGYIGVMTPIVALVISAAFESFRWHALTWLGIAVSVVGNVVILRGKGR